MGCLTIQLKHTGVSLSRQDCNVQPFSSLYQFVQRAFVRCDMHKHPGLLVDSFATFFLRPDVPKHSGRSDCSIREFPASMQHCIGSYVSF